MSDDLAAFLKARLDRDEAVARAASWTDDANAWHAEPSPFGARDGGQRWYVEDAMDDGVVSHVDPVASDDESVARHIARHDPARVLREVEAKRQIVDLHPYTTQRAASSETSLRSAYGPNWEKRLKNLDTPYCETCDVDDGVIASDGTPCETLRLLALPYADHPDYREKWRP